MSFHPTPRPVLHLIAKAFGCTIEGDEIEQFMRDKLGLVVPLAYADTDEARLLAIRQALQVPEAESTIEWAENAARQVRLSES